MLSKQQSDFKRDINNKSELKLPRLLNNNSSDLISNRNTNNGDTTKIQFSMNASILNGSMSTNNTSKFRRAKYFLDNSIISEQTGQDIAQKMEYINLHEQKKIMQPELETDFDLANFLLSKNEKDNKNLPQHYMLQDDLKTYFNVEKKPVYAKISTVGKTFPLKVKVTATEGTYDFHFSFFEPFPDKEKQSEEFPQRKEHLYKFLKPKQFSQWAYFCLTSKDSAKIELKVWFTNQKLEKFRSQFKSTSNKIANNQSLSLKEKLKIELSEQEKKALYLEVMQIKQKKFQKLKMQDQQIIDRNKELAANYHLLQKKKEFDHILHKQRCEEVIRRSISQQLLNYQEKYQKYFSKVINHRINLEKVARKKFQQEVNTLAFNWIPFIKLAIICDKLQEKIYVSKLASIFKGRRVRAFEELVRTFKGKKFEIKPYMNDKQRLMSDILLSMNVKAKQIKKIKKKMAAKVLIYFVHNQKQNSVLNTIVALSKKMLHQVQLIQKKRRQTVNLHQFITMKMLDGLFEQLKDEDFKKKQLATSATQTTDLSYYINFIKKKDKQILVKEFLKIVKEKFKHYLSLSTGKRPPITEEDLKFMEIEAKTMKKDVADMLDIRVVNRKEIVYEAVEIMDEVKKKEELEKKQQEADDAEMNEQIDHDQKNSLTQKYSQFDTKYKLDNRDWNLLEIVRNTQAKIRIIQSRHILRDLLIQRLTEIKAEKDEGLNQIYLTQNNQ
ncbi:hypothetical protein TTHERM_00327060 (macronuclear) [Tetrahymena thermophila SB210]|uniref:Uncharacterized protein n=1 Tax=Tetrahymena thermophila (strain SB210) TaxID=312017 RepID=I7M4C6_TETTS|nr:hypothetical protein TTHERM_00327060 [Tetrahymena thermophila SB210]EAS06224.2 hypothetical protein TTHERM_00327060 [Tetrahymena thermophila SB210]|eukprot:XP_001026469.2 hypothetical protein TTHERM_00327060 [Tetrahymena thermophila SB210]